VKKLLLVLLALLISTIIFGCAAPTQTPATTTPAKPVPAASTPSAPAPAATTPVTPKPAATTPSTTAAAKTPKYGGTFRFIAGGGPGAPFGTPWLTVGGSTASMQLCLETPFKELIDGSLVPSLAESYTVDTSADKPSITFKLKKGIKFHDGTDFNAAAMKWNLDKVSALGSTQIANTTNWKSSEVVDDYTIRINLKSWQNTALNMFANAVSYVISPAAFQKNGVEWTNWNMVGTGAFVQTDFQRDVSMTVVRNPSYWQQGKPYLDKIQTIYVPDAMTAEVLFKTGGGEVIQCASDKMADNLKRAGFKIISYPGVAYIMYPDSKNADSPWSNLKFRMAAEYAIDKEAIANAFGYGTWTPSYQYPPPTSPAFNPALAPRKYDAAKAKQLLAEAGFPNGVKTTIHVSPSGANQDIALAIQAEWAKVGIQAALQNPQAGAWSLLQRGTWSNGCLFGPGATSTNPLSGFNYYTTTGTMFLSVKRPDGFDALYQAALGAPKLDPALAQKCGAAMYNEVTIIPLFVAPTTWAVADYVQDHGLGTRGIFSMYEPQNLWLSK